MKKLINSLPINKSELARKAGIPPNTLKYKLNAKNKYNEFTPEEEHKLKLYFNTMANLILKQLK